MRSSFSPVGWRYESYRHRLASQGISTTQRSNEWRYFAASWRPGIAAKVQGVAIRARSIQKGQMYPITPGVVKRFLQRQKSEDVRGLKAVEFVPPGDKEQEGAYAQYVRSKRKILIFAQPYENGLLDGQDPKWVREHVESYVLPHELGHHKALYVAGMTDKSLPMAEARADANVVGMSPKDRDVKLLRNV